MSPARILCMQASNLELHGRGPKIVIKLFPHAASDLEPAVKLLEGLGTKVCVRFLKLPYYVFAKDSNTMPYACIP